MSGTRLIGTYVLFAGDQSYDALATELTAEEAA
jgi:hypothetical protein